MATALAYQVATDCNACIPSAANKEAVFVLSNTASNLPSGESANQITFLLESKYSAGTTLGLYRITQVLYCHSNPMREYLRRGYSFDNGATWTFNDWEKVITKTDLSNYAKITKFNLGTTRSYTFELTPSHVYRVTLGHPTVANKSGLYMVYFQSSAVGGKVDNDLSQNNYSVTINQNTLTITSTTDYGLGTIEDLGVWV